MAQIRTGTCTVTNASANVIASAGNDWSQAGPNCLFSIPATDGSSVLYTVATAVAPGVSPSGFWELNLTANYAGDDAAAVAYQITKDFTPTLGLPIIHYGDTDTAILLNKIALILEASIEAAAVTADAIPFLGTFINSTGGTSDDVDSVPTTALDTAKVYAFNSTTEGVKFLMLNAGTTATTAPGSFRPTDYNASTNAKYWSFR